MPGPLEINADRTSEEIVEGIRQRVLAEGAEGVLLGLSGGVDSSLLASLAVRAVGPGAVHGVYLFDWHSSSRLRACARAVADQLGLDFREQSITGEMHSRGLYAAAGMRATGLAGWLNRFLHNLYRRSTGETPFLAALKAHENPPANWYQSLLAQAEMGMNDRHRYRREVLEALAREQDWLLLGAANRSEWLVGWFVKDGIDDLPIQPLIGLYKTQVRQLAGQLGLPACVLANRPSPDMMPGITDEFAIGVDYVTLDLVLGHLQGELGENELSSSGVTTEEIEYVRELARCSAWKRAAS